MSLGIRSSEVEKVFKWWDYLVFAFLTVSSISAILYFMHYWFSFQDWLYFPVSFTIATAMLAVTIINNQGRWFLLPFMKKPGPSLPKSGWKVAVVTTFVPSSEPLDMLKTTLQSLIAMDYPHDTWVLDEGDDERVRSLCVRFGADYFTRKNLTHYQEKEGIFKSYSKHGNYNAWLNEVGFDRYDIISTFDPDHIPKKDFLIKVLGYFNDPGVGYVQAAQAYYNQRASFIARGAAEETYAYYSSIQMAIYGMDYPIIVGGHNTHRVSALKEVGGFAPHDADDLLLTLFYRAKGWRGIYVPEVLARGLTPVNWNDYLAQQRRWARSVLDLKIRYYPKITNNLAIKSRVISFLHGLNYLQRGMIVPAGLLFLIFMLASGGSPKIFSFALMPKVAILFIALQLCEFYRQRFYLDWHREWGLHWRVAVLQFAKWPCFLLALCDVIFARKIPYAITTKKRTGSRRFSVLWPNVCIVLSIGIGGVVAVISGNTLNSFLAVLAFGVASCSLALIFTEFMMFPSPFDEELIQPNALERQKR